MSIVFPVMFMGAAPFPPQHRLPLALFAKYGAKDAILSQASSKIRNPHNLTASIRFAFLGSSAKIKASLFNPLEHKRSHLSEVCNLRQSAALRQRGQPR
jgi:hypothetical protein